MHHVRREGSLERTAEDCFRAARTCDDVLAALAAYRERDASIERLEVEITNARVEALLHARQPAAAV